MKVSNAARDLMSLMIAVTHAYLHPCVRSCEDKPMASHVYPTFLSALLLLCTKFLAVVKLKQLSIICVCVHQSGCEFSLRSQKIVLLLLLLILLLLFCTKSVRKIFGYGLIFFANIRFQIAQNIVA